ncbi:hypothetical protein BDF14DRAFT_1696444, partial [Spinellus fusiger]
SKHAQSKTKQLVHQARQMKIMYDVLPAGMSRNKLNTSNYSPKIPSGLTLRSFFENMLFAEKPIGKTSYTLFRYQVQEFIDAGMDHCVIGLRKEGVAKRVHVDITHCLDKPLSMVLQGERIIEFPILSVWLKGD